jgi:hypothetical protein
MDGHAPKRYSTPRTGRLALEPLEDRFLLSSLLALPTGLAATVSAQSNPAVTIAGNNSSPTTGSAQQVEGEYSANPAPATPAAIRPPSPAIPTVSVVSLPSQAAPSATSPAAPDRASAPSGVSGQASSKQADAAPADYPSTEEHHAGVSSNANRTHDRDDSTYTGDDDDDDDGEHGTRVAEEATEVHTETEIASERSDVVATPGQIRELAASDVEETEQLEVAAPEPLPVKTVVPSEPAVCEKELAGSVRAEPADFQSLRLAQDIAIVQLDVRLRSEEIAAIFQSREPIAEPPADFPVAGEIGVNLRAIEQGMEAFFSRLSSLSDDGTQTRAGISITSWLTVVAAAAHQVARLRDKARQASIATDERGQFANSANGDQA